MPLTLIQPTHYRGLMTSYHTRTVHTLSVAHGQGGSSAAKARRCLPGEINLDCVLFISAEEGKEGTIIASGFVEGTMSALHSAIVMDPPCVVSQDSPLVVPYWSKVLLQQVCKVLSSDGAQEHLAHCIHGNTGSHPPPPISTSPPNLSYPSHAS